MSFVEGQIIDILFRNDENGYTVVELDDDGKYLVCVGSMPPVNPGEYVRFYGAMTTHKVYGEQFKVVSMESRMPEGDESIRAYLSGGLFKGIGHALATRIVDAFHEETFHVIENEPERLAKVKGISLAAARRINQTFVEQSSARSAVIDLQKLGLSTKQAMACLEVYGGAAPSIISENPYRMIGSVAGIGFEKADAIAAGLDLPNYTALRTENGIRHVLSLEMSSGHTCFPFDMFIGRAAGFLQDSSEHIEDAVHRLVLMGTLSEMEYNGVPAIALYSAHSAEAYDGRRLMELATAQPAIELDMSVVEEILAQDTVLTEEQERAVLSSLSGTVSVVTGGPGTGKTTILKQLITILERSGVKTALAAPTGRAAKRMEQACMRPAQTIHRLLEYGFSKDGEPDSVCRFQRDEENPLEADAVIIDETSMVDIFLLRALLQAVKPGSRLIFTGDADQLPSVGPGNVIKDMIKSRKITVSCLTEVFRQHGNIAEEAQIINKGGQIDLFDTGDFIFVPARDADETLEAVKRLFGERVNSGVPLDEVQVICPIKKGRIGVYTMNRELRDIMNPRMAGKTEMTMGDTAFRIGDKVMQTSNNYSKEWYIRGTLRSLSGGVGVFNGDIGVISDIDDIEKTVEILFDGERVAAYDYGEMEQIEHSYAITIHKSQGSEFDTVILPLFYGQSPFLTRNLLYTAVTRAKKKLILVGNSRTVYHMVQNNRITGRYTGLNYEIQNTAQFLSGLSGEGMFADRQE